MTSPNNPSEPAEQSLERRDYFRIEDRIGLEIRKLSPMANPDEKAFGDDHLESLKAEYRRLDQDVRSQLASLAERDRLLTGLIKSLNGKLDTLARIMAFEQNPLQPEDWREVTLSEGGLAFTAAPETFRTGNLLTVRMTLPPELFQPRAIAEIIHTHPDNAGGVRIHSQFVHIHDSDRQQIARHVMRWQIRQRKKE